MSSDYSRPEWYDERLQQGSDPCCNHDMLTRSSQSSEK